MKEGDIVEIVHRCGGQIAGKEPEIYEVGERYTIHFIVRARKKDDNGIYLLSDEPALILKPNAGYSVPFSAVRLVL